MGIFKNLQKIAIPNRDSRARIFNGNAINAAKVLYRLADA
jgi:hypothetical protein